MWNMLFEQTPVVIRGALGVLTLGIFTLASVLYRWHKDDLQKVHVRIDSLEGKMEQRQAETNRLLFQIAQNTDRGSQ